VILIKSVELVLGTEKPETSVKKNEHYTPHSLSSSRSSSYEKNPLVPDGSSSSLSSTASFINELNECYRGLNNIGLPTVFINCVIIQLFHALSSSLFNMYVKNVLII
jgi:hypothetical protein